MSFYVFCAAVAVLYPVGRFMVNRWNDRSDQALREAGFSVPYRRRQVGQGVPRVKQPPVPGMRGPIEGRFWGQFFS